MQSTTKLIWLMLSLLLLSACTTVSTFNPITKDEFMDFTYKPPEEEIIPPDINFDINVDPVDMPTPTVEIYYPNWKYKSLDTEVDCLAKNIYYESRQEPIEGQIAVGLVTINRLKSEQFQNSICDVVWRQDRIRKNVTIRKHHHVRIVSKVVKVAQFSWTLDRRCRTPKDLEVWIRIKQLAQSMLKQASLDNYQDFTKGALWYHTFRVHPKWRHEYEVVVRIGNHIFYRNPNDCTGCKYEVL